MRRVLHFISGLGTGGAESFLVAMARGLAARGFDQRVVSLTGLGTNGPKLEAHGIPVLALNVGGPLSAAMSIAPLREALARAEPDVIQGWMYHGDLFATLAHRLAKCRPRLLWNIRCSDMRLDDYALQLRLVVKACARLSRRPDVVLANSRAGADAHLALGYTPRRLEFVPNGIDTARFRPEPDAGRAMRNALGLAPDALVFLHVARVDPMKDHATLLAAFEGVPGVKLVLAGKGTEAMSSPPHVLGLGVRDDVPRLMAASDIVISSSAYGEGFSNAIAEGMAAGLVPVATDCGDVREIIGDTGFVAPARDVAALRRAIERVTALTVVERERRRQAARARIETMFSLDTAVSRFAALYS